jgi:hypothetical protein
LTSRRRGGEKEDAEEGLAGKAKALAAARPAVGREAIGAKPRAGDKATELPTEEEKKMF